MAELRVVWCASGEGSVGRSRADLDGKQDGGPDFRKAIALRPDYAPAKTAAREAENRGKPVWMLYIAGFALAGALALLGMAAMRRRA